MKGTGGLGEGGGGGGRDGLRCPAGGTLAAETCTACTWRSLRSATGRSTSSWSPGSRTTGTKTTLISAMF